MRFDLKTTEGLRNACREAERQLDQESIARSADFLEQVSSTPESERDREEFVRLVWLENPLVEIDTVGGYDDVTEAVAAPDFRQRFLKLTTARLPEDSEDRVARLDKAYDDVLSSIKRYMPRQPNGNQSRPRMKAARAFAALFPNDFTTIVRGKNRKTIYEAIGERPGKLKYPAQESRTVLRRLDDVLGAVDRSDWSAVARRMMLPEVIFREFLQQRPSNSSSNSVAEPLQDAVGPRPLDQIKEYFKSLRNDGELVFDDEVVEALHLGLWAHEQRHFGVLTGLSGYRQDPTRPEIRQSVDREWPASRTSSCVPSRCSPAGMTRLNCSGMSIRLRRVDTSRRSFCDS